MRKLRLLSTAAAIALLGAGIATAQEMKKDETPARAPAAQQNAPAEKVAPAQKIAPALKSERKTPETTGQAPPSSDKSEMKERTQGKRGPAGGSPQESSPANGGSNMKSKTENAPAAPSGKSATEEHRSTTTGQGAAAGSAKLSTEQRTKISTVFKQHRVTPTHLNVSVRVGTRVPDSVHFYPIPEEVVVIYPEWRGYDYIYVGDQIVVIDPRSHEIVAILEA